jgi:hypothetical protein
MCYRSVYLPTTTLILRKIVYKFFNCPSFGRKVTWLQTSNSASKILLRGSMNKYFSEVRCLPLIFSKGSVRIVVKHPARPVQKNGRCKGTVYSDNIWQSRKHISICVLCSYSSYIPYTHIHREIMKGVETNKNCSLQNSQEIIDH